MSKIYKINIETEEKNFQSITCGSAKIFLHFANMIQTQVKEVELKNVKEAQDALNAHGVEWEEFDSKDCDKAIFAIHKQNAIKELEENNADYQTATELILKTFESPEPQDDEVLPEPDVVTAEGEETTAAPPASYAKCYKCAHENYLRDGQVKCGSCGDSIAVLKRIACKNPECTAEMYVTDNVKVCPYCDKDLYSVEERLENAGVIPTDDPVKASEIAEKKKQELDYEYGFLSKREISVGKITNPTAKESLSELMQAAQDDYNDLINELVTETDEKKIKSLATCKNKANTLITQILGVRNAIQSFDCELTQLKHKKESINNKRQNFQMPINLYPPKNIVPVVNQIETANKEAAEVQELPETVNPVLEEQPKNTEVEEVKEMALAGGMEEEQVNKLVEEYQETAPITYEELPEAPQEAESSDWEESEMVEPEDITFPQECNHAVVA